MGRQSTRGCICSDANLCPHTQVLASMIAAHYTDACMRRIACLAAWMVKFLPMEFVQELIGGVRGFIANGRAPLRPPVPKQYAKGPC